MAQAKKTVTVIPGDGIGPEVVRSAQRIIEAAGVAIEWDEQQAGAEVFRKGLPSGVPAETIDSIRRNGVALKGPLETPVGFGEKSANVTLRKLFETYGNIRPARELPGVETPYSGRGVDLIVVRENIEDLYAGIEHMQTPGVAQALKLISRRGCERIVRLAFEVARAEGRKSVACATKANILKFTEGMMKQVFEEVAPEYPDIESWHVIIDNCAHQMVKRPEQFDVIVTTNMNGDIISDLSSALVGGLGLAPSANLGDGAAIFEAVHGSAPKYAGKNVINPTALILSAVQMLRHIGESDAAVSIENSIAYTLQSGVRTRDLVGDEGAVSTTGFTDAVIANLGNALEGTRPRTVRALQMPKVSREAVSVVPAQRRVIGADIFVEYGGTPKEVGDSVASILEGTPLHLKMVSNRGTQVWPATSVDIAPVDQWRCRTVLRDANAELTDDVLLDVLARIAANHRWMHLEKLQEFDGKPSYTKAQGED